MAEQDKKNIRIQSRADTAANWASNNPILLDREIGYEIDTGRYKIGDANETPWNDLSYLSIGASSPQGGEIFNSESNIAVGKHSHAEGYDTQAAGDFCHAEGAFTTAIGILDYFITGIDEVGAHAEGFSTTAEGPGAHAEGYQTNATGQGAHAEGYETQAGDCSHAEGLHAEADNTSHAEGYYSQATGYYSHAEGEHSKATKRGAHAEGFTTQATGLYSHAEGDSSIAEGNASHAEGYLTQAIGQAAHAEGRKTKAIGSSAHAENDTTKAIGHMSHAEGSQTKTGGIGFQVKNIRLMNYQTILELVDIIKDDIKINQQCALYLSNASSNFQTFIRPFGNIIEVDKENKLILIDKDYPNLDNIDVEDCYLILENQLINGANIGIHGQHAEGFETWAFGYNSHAEGNETLAAGSNSHAEGYLTIAASNQQHVEGMCNIEDNEHKYIHIAGNGKGTSASSYTRSNAYTLDWDGNAWFAGGILLTAPNGKKFKITVDNSGNLKTTEFTEY